MHSLADMATAMFPIRSDRAAEGSRATGFDDDESDAFMGQLDDDDDQPPPPKPSVATQQSTDMLPNSTTGDMPPSDIEISATVDQQMMPGSGVASDVIAGDVAASDTRKNALASSPTGTNRSVPSVAFDPTPKRRRLRGKSNPPPELWSCSNTPMSTPRSRSMCSSIASPVSTSSTDDSRADYDLSKGGLQVPVDEWRSQYNRAFEIMRRYFYNSAEHHDLKLLPHGQAGQLRKRLIYKQWACKRQSEQARLAGLAMKSKHLSEEEKTVANTRYLLKKKSPPEMGSSLNQRKASSMLASV